MARPDPLIVLIRSMSRREKQHFKREASAQSEHARYAELFDAIARSAKASDDEIKARLEAEWGAKKLKPLKAYLFKAVSRSLIQYLEGQVPSDEARFLLRQAALLKDRGLQDKALKALDRAARLAGESHRQDLLWQTHEVRRIVLAGRRDKLYRRENLHAALEGMETAAEKLLEYSRALRLYYRVWEGNWRSDREARSALLEAMEAPECRRMAESSNATTRLYYLLAWSHFHVLESNLEASEARQREVLTLYAEEPGLLEENPQFQFSTAYNLANRLLMRQQLDSVPELVERIRNTPTHNTRMATKRLECIAAHAYHYAALTGQELEGSQWAEALQAESEAPMPFAASHRIDIAMKRGLYHWTRGRPEQAIDAFLENERDADLKRMPIQFAVGRMALLLAHVDLGNRAFAAERAAAILRQNRFDHTFERPMYLFLQRLPKTTAGSNLEQVVQALQAELHQARTVSDYRLYLPLDVWLEVLVRDAAFAEGLQAAGAHWPRIPH